MLPTRIPTATLTSSETSYENETDSLQHAIEEVRYDYDRQSVIHGVYWPNDILSISLNFRKLGSDITVHDALCTFTNRLVQNSGGRALDITDVNGDIHPGRTTYICVPRHNILQAGTQEVLENIQQATFDCCIPLEVDFYAQGAVWWNIMMTQSILANVVLAFVYITGSNNYGGPRREFFQLYLQQAKEKFVSATGSLIERPADVQRESYFVLVIVMGMFEKDHTLINFLNCNEMFLNDRQVSACSKKGWYLG